MKYFLHGLTLSWSVRKTTFFSLTFYLPYSFPKVPCFFCFFPQFTLLLTGSFHLEASAAIGCFKWLLTECRGFVVALITNMESTARRSFLYFSNSLYPLSLLLYSQASLPVFSLVFDISLSSVFCFLFFCFLVYFDFNFGCLHLSNALSCLFFVCRTR